MLLTNYAGALKDVSGIMGDNYNQVQWSGIRDGIVYIKKDKRANANIRILWWDAYNADATKEHVYVLGPRGELVYDLELETDNVDSSQYITLDRGAGIYTVHFPGYSARSFSITVYGSRSIYEPARVHQHMSIAADLVMYLAVPANSAFTLCGKVYDATVNSVSGVTLTNVDDGGDVHTLNMTLQAYYQDYQTLAVSSTGVDRVFAVTFSNGGRLSVWVDGIQNTFARYPDQLFTLEYLSGYAKITAQDYKGAAPLIGATLPHEPLPTAAQNLCDKWNFTATSLYHFENYYQGNPTGDTVFLNYYENTLGLSEYLTTIRVDPTVITDTNAATSYYNAYLKARHEAGYLNQGAISFADEANLNYGSTATYNAQYVEIATAIKSSNDPSISNTLLAFPQSSRCSRGPVTNNSALKRGIDQLDYMLGNHWDKVDVITYHEWHCRRLIATRWFSEQINDVFDLMRTHKPAGASDKPIVISQTNISSGDAVSQYEQNTFYTSLWWVSVVCHSASTGRLAALIYFLAFSDYHHSKGLANNTDPENITERIVGDAMTFVTAHMGATTLNTEVNHPEVNAVVMRTAGGLVRVLGVNIGKRQQTVTLVIPDTVASFSMATLYDGGTSSSAVTPSGRVATFTVNAETIFALDEAA